MSSSKEPEFRTGFSVKQQFNPHVTVTLGSDLNLRSVLGESVGEPHTFGIEFKLSDEAKKRDD